ncbi:MAG: hypothetical protein GVY16_12430 [Planctomycetes bacterium]|jgi:competence protein ComGC|nr:hypothetical protein [Planctomycetota bacterium]
MLAVVASPLPAEQTIEPTLGDWAYVWAKANFEDLYGQLMRPGRRPAVVLVVRHPGKKPAFEILVCARGKFGGEFFEQWKATHLPLLEAQVKRWQKAGMDVSMDDFRVRREAVPPGEDEIKVELQTLNAQTQLYKFKEGKLPTSVEDLVGDYLHEAPDVAGGKFVIDKQGRWTHVPGKPAPGPPAPNPVTPQQADRWNQTLKPAAGEWAFVWAKTNFEDLTVLNGPPDDPRLIGAVVVVRHPGRTPETEVRILTATGKDNAPFCRKWTEMHKPRLEAQVKAWQDAGVDISMDDITVTPASFRSGANGAAVRVQTLNSQTALFKFKNDRLPKDIDELVKAGLLVKAPDAAGGEFVMNEQGLWTWQPPAQQVDTFGQAATPARAKALAVPIAPAFGNWAFVWTKANMVDMYRIFAAGWLNTETALVRVLPQPGKPQPIQIRVHAEDGQPDAGPYLKWLKTEKPKLSEQVTRWRAAGYPIAMDDFDIKVVRDPGYVQRRKAMAMMRQSDISTLNAQTQLFKFKEGRLPKNLQELLDKGLLMEMPEAKGGSYVMDEQGQWSFQPVDDASKKPDPKAVANTDGVSEEKAARTAKSLASVARLFKAREGRWPKDVHELVAKDYIGAVPPAPDGKGYAIDAKTGEVSIVAAEDIPAPPKEYKPLKRHVRETARSNLKMMRAQLQLFKFKTDHWPKTLDELVDKGLMESMPAPPEGREWLYDAKTGEVTLEGEDL